LFYSQLQELLNGVLLARRWEESIENRAKRLTSPLDFATADMEKDLPHECAALQAAVEAVQSKQMSLRAAETRFGVSKSKIQRRTSGEVKATSRNGPEPLLTPGEIEGIVDAVDARTMHGRCFTKVGLALCIRKVVENSPYQREIDENFPSKSFIQRFVAQHKVAFGTRRAQTLEVCRAKASTTANVERHYKNLKQLFDSLDGVPPSRIWNLDETGMCPQERNSKQRVLASKGKRANVQESDDRTNVSALVCVNADGGYVPPFFIMPGKNVRRRSITGGSPGATFAASDSSFLTTHLFIQYFEWFVKAIPTERPVVVVADGYKCHFSSRTLRHARASGIHLYALPAHTSHFLQPLDVTLFHHFKRFLEDEKMILRTEQRRSVERADMVALASRALERCFTRAYIVAGFEKAGVYPLSKAVMMKGVIGDGPLVTAKANMVKLTANTIITPRTASWLKRKGLDADTTRVLSMNQWELDDLTSRKKKKLIEAPDQYVHGGVVMTADAVIQLVENKEEVKRVQLEEKLRRKVERAHRASLLELAKADAAVARREREERIAHNRLQREITRKEKEERKLWRLEDPRRLARMIRKGLLRYRVPEPEPSLQALV
jgi:hypothetical protein